MLDLCPEPSATGAYLASTARTKIASLFHLHKDECNKCLVLVQQPVVQRQESGPVVRVSPSLPEAEIRVRDRPFLELLHSLLVNMNEAATMGGGSARPPLARTYSTWLGLGLAHPAQRYFLGVMD